MDEAELRHQYVQDTLVARLQDYGYHPATNIVYKDDDGRTIGELDVILTTNTHIIPLPTPRIYKVEAERQRWGRVYEVKGHPRHNYRHASRQLKRFRDYVKDRYDLEVKMVYVSMNKGKLVARRVR